MDLTVDDAKRAARELRDQIPDAHLTHSRALEIVAAQLGFRDWNVASAVLPTLGGMGAPIPVLRSLDETRAREFYIDYLHFTIEWEHRFDDELPLYRVDSSEMRAKRLFVASVRMRAYGVPI